MLGIYNDTFIAEYQKLTETVHRYGSAIIMQLVHGGSNTGYKVAENPLIAPSAVEHIARKRCLKKCLYKTFKQ